MSVQGRRALVTGGAGGIGVACARGLAEAGAEVVIADSSGEACEKALAELPAEVSAITLDVTDRAACEAAFGAEAVRGGVDILVTCAAVVKAAPILEFDPGDWARILDVNLTGSFHCCQLAARQMVARGLGADHHVEFSQRSDRQCRARRLCLFKGRGGHADAAPGGGIGRQGGDRERGGANPGGYADDPAGARAR